MKDYLRTFRAHPWIGTLELLLIVGLVVSAFVYLAPDAAALFLAAFGVLMFSWD